jgi:hypothetical protein
VKRWTLKVGFRADFDPSGYQDIPINYVSQALVSDFARYFSGSMINLSILHELLPKMHVVETSMHLLHLYPSS